MPAIIKKAPADLKTRKYHIFCSWILLTFFVAGQYMVYAHQHNISAGISKTIKITNILSKQTLKEKCTLCDVMHHTQMVASGNVKYNPAVAIRHKYINIEYSFTSIQLISSGGRSPPSIIYFV